MIGETRQRGHLNQFTAATPVDFERAADVRRDDRGNLGASVAVEVGNAHRIEPAQRRADRR